MQNLKVNLSDIRIESAEFSPDSHTNDKTKMISLINDALKSRLYVSGSSWGLAKSLSGLRNELRMRISYNYNRISIAYYENIPVAVLLEYSFDHNRCAICYEAFCKKDYRRNGILTELIKKSIQNNISSKFYVRKGSKESIQFWLKIKKAFNKNIVIADSRIR